MLAEEGGDVGAARDEAPVLLTRLGQDGGYQLGGHATTAQFLGDPGMVEQVAVAHPGVSQPGELIADEPFKPLGGGVVLDDEGWGFGDHVDEWWSLAGGAGRAVPAAHPTGALEEVGDARMNEAGGPVGTPYSKKCFRNTSLS